MDPVKRSAAQRIAYQARIAAINLQRQVENSQLEENTLASQPADEVTLASQRQTTPVVDLPVRAGIYLRFVVALLIILFHI
jgi:hypothetical protein